LSASASNTRVGWKDFEIVGLKVFDDVVGLNVFETVGVGLAVLTTLGVGFAVLEEDLADFR